MIGYLIAYWMFRCSSYKDEIEEDLKRHTNKIEFLSFILDYSRRSRESG